MSEYTENIAAKLVDRFHPIIDSSVNFSVLHTSKECALIVLDELSKNLDNIGGLKRDIKRVRREIIEDIKEEVNKIHVTSLSLKLAWSSGLRPNGQPSRVGS